jgi:hypothetical protein
MSIETAKKPAPKAAPKATLGVMVDQVFKLRTKKAELEAAVKDVSGQIANLESELLERMKAEGVEKTSGKGGTVSVGTSVVADVTDWDAFLSFIYKNKFGHLLQRRVSDPAWRELIEQKGKVPGTQPFTKVKLNFRSAS